MYKEEFRMPLQQQFYTVHAEDMRIAGRVQVIDAILALGDCTAQDISEHIGLSRQTVMKAIRYFLTIGVLEELGKGDSTATGGKRPILYGFTRSQYFLCISLWPRETRLVLYTIGKIHVDTLSLSVPLPDTLQETMENAGKLAETLLQKHGIPIQAVKGVSISTCGTVSRETGLLLYNAQRPSWGRNVPMLQYLTPFFAPGTMFVLDKAGKMAAQAEQLNPNLQNKRAVVFFTAWDLSASLIERRRTLSGKNNLIGEIGHMIIYSGDHETCYCGGRGCAERMCHISRIRYLMDQARDQYPPSSLEAVKDTMTIPEFFEHSRAGDPLARYISIGMGWVFGTTLRNMSLTFDPDLVIFQGDYAYADETFQESLLSELDKFSLLPKGSFTIEYDRRPLHELDSIGSFMTIAYRYFTSRTLLNGEEES